MSEYPIGDEKLEIVRLSLMLSDANIPFEMHEHSNGFRLCYPNEWQWYISVIQNEYSYGGRCNLLEACTDKKFRDVEGFLTADEVFKVIKEHFECLKKGGQK